MDEVKSGGVEAETLDVKGHEGLNAALGVSAIEMVWRENEVVPTPTYYQEEALEVLKTVRRDGEKKALVTLATGLGKTWLAAFDIERFTANNPQARILYLAQQNEILSQAEKTFRRILGEGLTYGQFHGQEKELDVVSCLFASFQAMTRWCPAFFPEEFDYVVVDESHHSQAPTYKSVIEYFKPGFLLAITATPDRRDLLDIRDLYGLEKYSLPLEVALARGLLSEVDYRVITDNIVEEGIVRAQEGKFSVSSLNKTIFAPRRDEEIAAIIRNHSLDVPNPRRIVFCPSVEYTEHMAAILGEGEPLHAYIPWYRRQAIIDDFKTGKVSTVFVVDMFNEGIDIPQANQIVFLRSTQSKTVFLQQLGRGLRRTDEKHNVQVLDFVANCERLVMVRELWKVIQGEAEDKPDEFTQVEVGNVQFDEAALDLLSLLENISFSYDKETLIAKLLALANDLGRTPSSRDVGANMERMGMPNFIKYAREFGSWNNAVVAAGLEPVQYRYTETEIVEHLKGLYQRLERVPVSRDIVEASKRGEGASRAAVFGRHGAFRSLPEALDAAGIPHDIPKRGYTAEELVKMLQDLYRQTGQIPNQKKLKQHGLPRVGSFIRHFGSWSAAIRAADLPERGSRNLRQELNELDEPEVKERLISYLLSLAETLNRIPTATDVLEAAAKDVTLPTVYDFRLAFKSWNNSIAAAGFTPTEFYGYRRSSSY